MQWILLSLFSPRWNIREDIENVWEKSTFVKQLSSRISLNWEFRGVTRYVKNWSNWQVQRLFTWAFRIVFFFRFHKYYSWSQVSKRKEIVQSLDLEERFMYMNCQKFDTSCGDWLKIDEDWPLGWKWHWRRRLWEEPCLRIKLSREDERLSN